MTIPIWVLTHWLKPCAAQRLVVPERKCLAGQGSFDCGMPSLREDIPSLRMTTLMHDDNSDGRGCHLSLRQRTGRQRTGVSALQERAALAPYFGANPSTSSGRALGRETVLRIRWELAFRDRARSILTESQSSLLCAGSHDESCPIPTLRALLPDKSVWRVDGRRTFLVLPLTSAAKAGIP